MVIGFWHASDTYGFCSNWYPAKITIENKIFNCCEQYMMYKKAILFKDTDTANKILQSDSPREIKALGRQVSNFNSRIWDTYKEEIVGTAVMAKFTQHSDLWKKLDATGDVTLAEASPVDRIWGIGLSPQDNIQDPQNWRGLNLLGQILMTVRSLIRQGISTYINL